MRILIVDDDRQQAENLADLLVSRGHDTVFRTDPVMGLAAFDAEEFELTLLDLRMPGIDGLTWLKRGLEIRPDARIVILTAYGTIDSAVEAMKKGAFDFLVKPVEDARLQSVLSLTENAVRMSRLAGLSAPRGPENETFIASNPAMRLVKNLIRRVAALSTTVLITGETGTGKELVARAIHLNSARKEKPFVAVNCANLQGALLESELFGHEKGAFTGADARKLGKFEVASGGTLFLDEVAEIPPELQAKLLRVLQEQEIERVGGVKPVRVDVRLVSATNKELAGMAAQGRFRPDLFYRINVFPIHLPPLRERPDDIPALAEHLLAEISTAHGRKPLAISPEAVRLLRSLDWPGNIRELRNVLERAAVIDEDDLISPDDLLLPAGGGRTMTSPAPTAPIDTRIDDSERRMIVEALEHCRGNVVAAARELDLPRRTLYDRLKRLAIEPAKYRKGETS